MFVYLDTSAAMKLVRPEEHSDHLSRWLSEQRTAPVLSSVLIEVELLRATRRSAPAALLRAAEVLRGIGVVALSTAIRARASGYPAPTLRSLDAIHLATAEHIVATTGQALEAFVAYDGRILDGARQRGLPVAAPGALP